MALVALTPVITLQVFGLVYSIKSRLAKKAMVVPESEDIIVELDYPAQEQEDEGSAENVASKAKARPDTGEGDAVPDTGMDIAVPRD